MKRKNKFIQYLTISLVTLALFLVTFELSYRGQWFDYYKAELKGLNPGKEYNSGKKKILIVGDSFTADPFSYVKTLRDSLTDYSIVNAAVPGTGIIQHSLYVPGRIKKTQPDVFIYQFYVGNDLFDISHPHQSDHISFSRKAYWWISDRWLSLPYLNFRLAGLRYKYYDDAGGSYKPKEKEEFSVDNYSKREKFNYKAEPGLVENSLFLENGRKNDWMIFEKKFRKIAHDLPTNTHKYFLIIPHASQISQENYLHHQQLGANLSKNIFQLEEPEYRLYNFIYTLCRELNFEVIDPLKVFRLAEENTPVYYTNDPHLNNAGQQLLGRYILMKFAYNE